MNADAVRLSYRTLRKHLGSALVELEKGLGYDTDHERGGLRMRRDWAVSYWKGTYRGKACLFLRWSHIEHIFLEE